MKDDRFTETVEKIVTEDPRFAPDAYAFISDAVLYTMQKFNDEKRATHHISGQELLEGIREFAINEFGPMAGEVFKSWGVKDSLCIGYIVFNMVDKQLLGRSDEDSIDDFRDGFDFATAFTEPFLPAAPDLFDKQEELPVIDE